MKGNRSHINATPRPPHLDRSGNLVKNKYFGSVLPRKFEAATKMMSEKQMRLSTLLTSKQEEDLVLYDILSGCTKRNPCHSAACPTCTRMFRMWFISQAYPIALQIPKPRFLTILGYKDMMSDDEVASFNSKQYKNRLGQQLTRYGLRYPVLGGLDLDYHSESKLWLPHFHLITAEEDTPLTKLRNLYSRKPNTRKKTDSKRDLPFQSKEFSDLNEVIGYLFKPFFSRIESYRSSTNNERRTKKYRLKPEQERLALRTRHRFEFSGLMFLHKARVINGGLRASLSSAKTK